VYDVFSYNSNPPIKLLIMIIKILRYCIYSLLLLCQNIHAEETLIEPKKDTIEITLQNHIFTPSEIKVPSHQKITLVINNLDDTVEEFDSPSLKREKILKSNSITKIILAPLLPGRYDFVGEFYQETAKGVVIVEE
jgi:hypothetical protein